MNQFFYINSSADDGAGMTVLREGLPSSPTLWEPEERRFSDKKRFPSRIIPWKQAAAEAMESRIFLTVMQRSLPTDFVTAWEDPFKSSFYVSRQVVEVLDKSGLRGWAAAAGRFRVVNRNGEFLRNEVFFDIIPLGEAPACDVENWEKITPDGKNAGYRKSADQTEETLKKPAQGHLFHRFLPKEKPWEGQHFMFAPGIITYTGQLLCSREVVELAHREQWTNAAFQPLDMPDRDYTDFRLRCWPPEKWYPRWHPAYDPALHEQECPDPSVANQKKLEEMREKYPAWISTEDFSTFEEIFSYVKRHAAILSKAPMEHSAEVAHRGPWKFTQIQQMLDVISEGSAEDGLLLAILIGPCNPTEINAAWYQTLSPGRQNKIRHFLRKPPRNEIQTLTGGDFLGDAEERQYISRQLGLNPVIPDRERFDGE
ncbi:MAG: hypothetical protein V4726_12510 [Verrucomicrobiota bacterium]